MKILKTYLDYYKLIYIISFKKQKIIAPKPQSYILKIIGFSQLSAKKIQIEIGNIGSV